MPTPIIVKTLALSGLKGLNQMPLKVKELHPPHGLARFGFRIPIYLYRVGLGGLLGKRFLLLTHIGRKSGIERQVVLEVVRYEKATTTFIVAAGFGPKSDWYQNIQKNPRVRVQCGHHRWNMEAHFLNPEQAGKEMLDYAHRYPLAFKELARFMGYELDGSEADIRAIGQTLKMVAFQPNET
jgi:deazaflavin-dependent oxidoreductase (nitroreductase family)